MSSTKIHNESHPADIFKIITVAGLLSKYADRVFTSKIDVSQTQYAVLSIVGASKSPVNESEISYVIQRGLNSVSTLVDRLVQQGLLRRTRSEEDRRVNYLTLTKSGREKVEKGLDAHKLLIKQMTGILTKEENQQILASLNKLEEYIPKITLEYGDTLQQARNKKRQK
jgi:DNA-binding MarR family transcriptional regulator